MKTLEIDIETYGDVDLNKCGVYRYCESPYFHILLFGYAVDSGEVNVVDIAQGEKIPDEILDALTDDSVAKWAFNANFERVCLSRYLSDLGISLDPFHNGHPLSTECARFLNPESWRCSMVWSAYLGLPQSLKGAGGVLKLENQKMDEGRALIKYFCAPCAPTKANGGRTRNLPSDAPEKWELFKSYNKRDVEVEMAIRERLSRFPVPDSVWEEFRIDQEINDRGVLVDMDLVHKAVGMDGRSREELTAMAKDITRLENPNSVQQMKRWLADNGLEMESLGKKEVAAAAEAAPKELRDVLELRQQLAKSSVKKYQAMENAACGDGRARGMFKFYGAGRTGRFCLTGDHEILTPDGWSRLDEWDGGKIACWNATSESVSFQPAAQLSFDYDGEMYTYADARIDQCSTPDHKMRVQRRYGGEWRDMTVEEMSKCSPCIPMFGYHFHSGCSNPTWLRVLIMTQADGFYKNEGIVAYNFKKQRKIERCKMLLRRAEITHTVKVHNGVTTITIPTRCVPLWLREFRTKTFGYWMFEENPDIIFDELPYWDGYYCGPNSIQYTTCNRQNADIIQALAHMSGKTAIIVRKKAQKAEWKDAYAVNIWLTPKNSHRIREKPRITEFHGKVYCAQTPTGYFLARRNGKVWVTGNSGRLVQLQNLPQNHLPDLAEARALVKAGDYEAVKMLYGDVPDTLSQLVRTAFVPKPGHKFIVADFSAIEARVIAWLAGERWKTEAFAKGEDIYCETASRMFGRPVVKNGVNGELRQKGKIAELACLAEGQPVLTNRGPIPIERVATDDLLWDGEEWVRHDGVICKGEREVITYDGLTATPDHPVWAAGRARPISLGAAASGGARLVRVAESDAPSGARTGKARVYDILNAGPRHRFTVSGRLVHNCGYGGSVGALKAMGALEMGVREDELKSLVKSWRDANPHIVRLWHDVDRAAMRAVKLRESSEVCGIRFSYESGFLFITLPSGRRLAYVKPRIGRNKFGSECVTYEGIGATKKWERIETYGPKLVENIVQATSRDILCHAMKTLRRCRIVMHIHDELVIEADPAMSLDAVCEQMGRTPDWASGLKLRADGYECDFYQKG